MKSTLIILPVDERIAAALQRIPAAVEPSHDEQLNLFVLLTDIGRRQKRKQSE